MVRRCLVTQQAAQCQQQRRLLTTLIVAQDLISYGAITIGIHNHHKKAVIALRFLIGCGFA